MHQCCHGLKLLWLNLEMQLRTAPYSVPLGPAVQLRQRRQQRRRRILDPPLLLCCKLQLQLQLHRQQLHFEM